MEVEKQISQWTLCTPLGFSETSMCLRVAKTFLRILRVILMFDTHCSYGVPIVAIILSRRKKNFLDCLAAQIREE